MVPPVVGWDVPDGVCPAAIVVPDAVVSLPAVFVALLSWAQAAATSKAAAASAEPKWIFMGLPP
jgi:hypothetical protein